MPSIDRDARARGPHPLGALPRRRRRPRRVPHGRRPRSRPTSRRARPRRTPPSEDVCDRIRLARPGLDPGVAARPRRRPGDRCVGGGRDLAESRAVVTLVEAEPAMVTAGRALASLRRRGRCARRAGSTRTPRRRRLREAELVIVSYVARRARARSASPSFVEHAWSCATDTLVVVEPGTTAGYERVLLARDAVHRRGRLVARSVPARRPCPLPDGRLVPLRGPPSPQPLHTALAKGGERGFEDEKLAYVVLCRSPAAPLRRPRVIRRPDLRHGPRRARPLHGRGPRATDGLEEGRCRVQAGTQACLGRRAVSAPL